MKAEKDEWKIKWMRWLAAVCFLRQIIRCGIIFSSFFSSPIHARQSNATFSFRKCVCIVPHRFRVVFSGSASGTIAHATWAVVVPMHSEACKVEK